MSNFFQNSDIDVNKAEKIVSDTLNKCDDGELYLEDSKSESILLDDNKIKSSNYTTDLGYGFRAITGDVVAYSHSNEISNKSLKSSSENLKSSHKSNIGSYNSDIKKTNQKFYSDVDPIETKSLSSKIELLNKINEYQIKVKDEEYAEFEINFFTRSKINQDEILNLLRENKINYQELKKYLMGELAWNKLINGLFFRLTSISDIEVDELISKNQSLSVEQAENLVIQRQLDLQSSKLLRDIMNEATIEYK